MPPSTESEQGDADDDQRDACADDPVQPKDVATHQREADSGEGR